MEIQLQELIEQIKQKGVDEAQAQAEAIVAAAKEQAEALLAQARAEADGMIAAAREENQRTVKVSEEAIRQAGRNVLLSFRDSVQRELRGILERSVDGVYSTETMAGLIADTVAAWAARGEAEDLAVILPPAELARLEDALLGALKERLVGGVTLRADGRLDSGFRIAVEGGRAYYDYSAEAVVDMMSAYLSPRVTMLLKEAGQS